MINGTSKYILKFLFLILNHVYRKEINKLLCCVGSLPVICCIVKAISTIARKVNVHKEIKRGCQIKRAL